MRAITFFTVVTIFCCYAGLVRGGDQPSNDRQAEQLVQAFGTAKPQAQESGRRGAEPQKDPRVMAEDIRKAVLQLRDQWSKSSTDLAGYLRKSVALRRKLASFRESLQPPSGTLAPVDSGGVHQSPVPVKPQPTVTGTGRTQEGPKSPQEQTGGTRPEPPPPDPAMMRERIERQRRQELSQTVKKAEQQLMSLDEQVTDLKSDPRRVRQLFDELDQRCRRLMELTSDKQSSDKGSTLPKPTEIRSP